MSHSSHSATVKALIVPALLMLAVSITSAQQSGEWVQSGLATGALEFAGVPTSLAISPEGEIYAGLGGAGGVVRSSDSGGTWHETGFDLPVNAVAVASTGTVFIGTSDSGIYRSMQKGANAVSLPLGAAGNRIYSIYIDNDDELFVGSREGLFHSSDNGDSWRRLGLDTLSGAVVDFTIATTGEMFAAHGLATSSSRGIVRSTDGGTTWSFVLRGPVSVLAHDQRGGVYGGTTPSTDYGCVYRSFDAGATWQSYCRFYELGVISLAVDSAGSIYAGTAGASTAYQEIFRSTDSGVTWGAYTRGIPFIPNTSIHSPPARDIAVDARGFMYAAIGGGSSGMALIARSVDTAKNWVVVSRHFSTLEVIALGADDAGAIYAGTQHGLFRTRDSGYIWEEASPYLARLDVRAVTAEGSGDVVIGTLDSGVYRSSDGGRTWRVLVDSISVRAILRTPDDSMLVGGNREVHRMGAQTGVGSTALLPGATGFVFSLARDSAGAAYAGTHKGELFRSTDLGESWVALPFTSPRADTVIGIAATPGGMLFAGTSSSGVYRSSDNGSTWQATVTGLTNPRIRSIAVDADGVLYAGTDNNGVFRSTSNGDAWSEHNTGLDWTRIWALLPLGDELFAGTIGGGVYRSTDGTTGVVRDARAHSGMRLVGITSEASGSPLEIRYELTRPGRVWLALYDLHGRLVGSLRNGEGEERGEHSVRLDGIELPSGIYFCRLSDGAVSISRTVVAGR